MEQFLWLIPLGFLVGVTGTLIGAGGGFVLAPVLLLLYPDERPEIITSITLAVVFLNAASGSIAYARMRRIDLKSGLLFAAVGIPGSIIGAMNTAWIPRTIFNIMFGILMISASLFLVLFSLKENKSRKTGITPPAENQAAQKTERAATYRFHRTITEKNGTVNHYSYNPVAGTGLSLFIGYISSLLGIGGGIIHVPVLVRMLNFPVHIAAATSHFVLAIMAFTGTIVHIVSGSFTSGIRRTIALGIGVLAGAQLGALLSGRIHSRWIITGLAVALGFVGIRVFVMAF